MILPWRLKGKVCSNNLVMSVLSAGKYIRDIIIILLYGCVLISYHIISYHIHIILSYMTASHNFERSQCWNVPCTSRCLKYMSSFWTAPCIFQYCLKCIFVTLVRPVQRFKERRQTSLSWISKMFLRYCSTLTLLNTDHVPLINPVSHSLRLWRCNFLGSLSWPISLQGPSNCCQGCCHCSTIVFMLL